MKTKETKKYVYLENVDKFISIMDIATVVVDVSDADYNKLPVYLCVGKDGWKHLKTNQYHTESDYAEIARKLENSELFLFTYVQAEGLKYSNDVNIHDTFNSWFDKMIEPKIKKIVNMIVVAQYDLAIQQRIEMKKESIIFPELM